MIVDCSCTTCQLNSSTYANDLMGNCNADRIGLIAVNDDGNLDCDKYIWDKLKKFRRVTSEQKEEKAKRQT